MHKVLKLNSSLVIKEYNTQQIYIGVSILLIFRLFYMDKSRL